MTYSDMNDNPAHAAAVMLAAKGIVCHENIAGIYYFYPDKQINRCDFTVMLMMASGIEIDKSITSAGFADDNLIPAQHIPYIAAAKAAGICDYRIVDGLTYFDPSEKVTRSQAAVMTVHALGITNITQGLSLDVFSDASSIPEEARSAFAVLCEEGMMEALPGGALAPNEALTRAQTASLLYGAIEYAQETQTQSFWERLFG
ncbi:MAG TPA: S-layer homology domain-containing protein [Bacillota bacterium]|nr:S-layer homology domain-containing protein [Bacillota bacterium]